VFVVAARSVPEHAPLVVLALTLRNLHLALTFTWVALGIPTIFWWKESILWVAVMSLYANVAGHWSAWQAARAEDVAKG
jgi:hypothetical protein